MGHSAEFESALRGPDAYRMARKALDAMVQHKVWPTPRNYELWLFYVANPKSPLAVEIDHFLKCIETGDVPVTDGEFGTEVVRAIEIAIEGAQSESLAVFNAA